MAEELLIAAAVPEVAIGAGVCVETGEGRGVNAVTDRVGLHLREYLARVAVNCRPARTLCLIDDVHALAFLLRFFGVAAAPPVSQDGSASTLLGSYGNVSLLLDVTSARTWAAT